MYSSFDRINISDKNKCIFFFFTKSTPPPLMSSCHQFVLGNRCSRSRTGSSDSGFSLLVTTSFASIMTTIYNFKVFMKHKLLLFPLSSMKNTFHTLRFVFQLNRRNLRRINCFKIVKGFSFAVARGGGSSRRLMGSCWSVCACLLACSWEMHKQPPQPQSVTTPEVSSSRKTG